MLAPNTKLHALCTSRAGDGTRIWLEGKRLLDHGFSHGMPCAREWSPNRLTIRPIDQAAFDALARSDRSTVAGSPARPILDITGRAIAAHFPTSQVMVTWAHNSITIEGV